MLPVDIIIDMLHPKKGVTITNVDKPKIKSSRKQDMARARNWNKMRVLGVISNLKTIRDSHTSSFDGVHDTVEKSSINLAITHLERMISYWNKNTKSKIDKIIIQK